MPPLRDMDHGPAHLQPNREISLARWHRVHFTVWLLFNPTAPQGPLPISCPVFKGRTGEGASQIRRLWGRTEKKKTTCYCYCYCYCDAREMKVTGGPVVAATVAAVASSAAALSYCTPLPDSISDPKFQSPGQGGEARAGDPADEQGRRHRPTDQFAPRFDGLRFIETLVTAHR